MQGILSNEINSSEKLNTEIELPMEGQSVPGAVTLGRWAASKRPVGSLAARWRHLRSPEAGDKGRLNNR